MSKGIHIDPVYAVDGEPPIGAIRGLREHDTDCNPGNCEDAHDGAFGTLA